VQVFNTVEPKSKREIRALTTDPFFVQSAVFSDSDELVLEYAAFYHLLPHFKSDFQKTLLIGGAGYTFPRDYLSKYPTAKIDVVEIDPQMTNIAKNFRSEENPRLNIITKTAEFI
jgi:spermidine synthase